MNSYWEGEAVTGEAVLSPCTPGVQRSSRHQGQCRPAPAALAKWTDSGQIPVEGNVRLCPGLSKRQAAHTSRLQACYDGVPQYGCLCNLPKSPPSVLPTQRLSPFVLLEQNSTAWPDRTTLLTAPEVGSPRPQHLFRHAGRPPRRSLTGEPVSGPCTGPLTA